MQQSRISRLPESEMERLFASAVRRYRPDMAAVDEVDFDAGLVTCSEGGRLFTHTFKIIAKASGAEELHVSAERVDVTDAVNTDAYAAGRVKPSAARLAAERATPLDRYRIALATRRGVER